MIELLCTCYMKRHLLNYDEKTEGYLRSIVERHGQYKKVTKAETGKSYAVPVGYIAVHGLREDELDNFQEWGKQGEFDNTRN